MNRRHFLSASGSTVAAVRAGRFPTVAPTPRGPDRTDAEDMRIQRLSWAGIKIELGTTTLLIDPLQTSPFAGGQVPEFAPITTNTEWRYVLVTHGHNDHYDAAAARAHLSERAELLCHRSLAPTIAGEGLRVRGLELHQTVILPRAGGELGVTAVEAMDGLGAIQVSWVITGGGRRVIHCGDTLWHGHWWRLAMQYGPFDAAFLPINGALVGWPVPPSGLPASLTPDQAAAAADILGVKLVCPIHYGRQNPPDYDEFPDALPRFLSAAQKKGIAVQVVRPGSWIALPPRG